MAKKSEQVVETVPAFSTEPQAFSGSYSIFNYKSFSFFLERMAESVHRTTVTIHQLESEVSRLKYEIMAMENEYKNLCERAADLETSAPKPKSSSELAQS